ncbi:MAG: DDE-type integrase/transposase/recombinase [Ktedonobacteraceae bacterium]|nr:DDE-type integrase/transposase/recombinase [Ktedonobacteraceae bacterium]
MLTDEEFQMWCQRLQLSPETEAIITRIRSSPPVRKVRGRANNVSGKYPSPKMQRSIQFESQHVELWGCYGMERDDDVLEYYDQAIRIPLQYRANSGRPTTQWHTPDFFVLRRASAGFEEWKHAKLLDKQAASMLNRYQPDPTGRWQCPPGETYAQSLGLSYRVRTSAEYQALYIENLKFLQDYWAHPADADLALEKLVMDSLTAYPGVSVEALRNAHPGLPLDILWAMLSKYMIFTDLETSRLTHHAQVFLYRDEAEMAQAKARVSSTIVPVRSLPSHFIFDSRLWQAEVRDEAVILQPEVGTPLILPLRQFQHMVAGGEMKAVTAATPSPMTQEMRQILVSASPKAQEEANRRLREILAYVRGETILVTPRSVQRWMVAYRAAEEQHGCGYLGLLDHVASRGNRTPRVSDASLQLLETYLKEHYATPQAKRAAAVYRLYREACSRQQIPPVSERTFYRERAKFTSTEVTTLRHGRRAAYAEQPFFWYLDQTTQRHGERPFALAHLDHTPLDIMLVSSVTGKPFAKPYLTMLTDAYSRRCLAAYVTYDPPSYRSAMMLFRVCVQRHQRLPQELVVDRGSDFGSVYFETLLSRYFITKKERPAQQPHFGSVIERLFGTVTTELLNQLRGNTQASKIPRQMTREVDPSHLAVWTLERFQARLCQWAYEVYDQMEHPALGQSPREAYAQGMELAGARLHRLIPYSEDFLMLTRPTTHTGQAKIASSRGITVNSLHYWNDQMRSPHVWGKTVPVRYEPYDMGVMYAFIEGQWLECIADEYGEVHGRSEREWSLILDEWREQQRQHGKKRVTVNGPLLAKFLEEMIAEEELLLQQQRDLEAQSIREAILGTLVPLTPESYEQQEIRGEIILDFTNLPRYEEYR